MYVCLLQQIACNYALRESVIIRDFERERERRARETAEKRLVLTKFCCYHIVRSVGDCALSFS